tara:strand:+ start:206 stop:499 length:294 start_codon:yes stop_codon:yes gene_type:complete
MNDEEIEMYVLEGYVLEGYVLEGEWKELYPKVTKHLLAEVKQLREERKQFHDLLAEVLPPKSGFPQAGVLLWGLESELKRVTGKMAVILGMAECEEE